MICGFRVWNLSFPCRDLVFFLLCGLIVFIFIFCLAGRDCVIKRAGKRIVDWEA